MWRIGRDGARSLLAALPPNGVPNGLALDARGNVYVADSALGTIWRVTPQGAVSAWVEHPLLRGGRDACPPGELPFDVGVNGIAFDRRGDLYAAVMDRGLIVRVPVNRDGSAGAPVVFAGPDCANLEGADGIAFDALGNLYVAVNHKNTVVRLTPAGRLDTLATGADGLDFPATVAFARPGGQGDLYLANFAFVSGDAARPSLMRLAVAAPGALPRTGGGPGGGAVRLAGAAAAAGAGLALAGWGARARRRR